MAGCENFEIAIEYEISLWPFSWGPFGGRKYKSIVFREGEVQIRQRERGLLNMDPVKVGMYSGSNSLTTTINFNGRSCLKRRTEKG